MSIAPKYAAQTLGPAGVNTIELYLDYVCPFSAKLYKNLRSTFIPALEEKYPGQFRFVFRHQVQPWHPSSTLVHEAGIAVSKLAPAKFWEFSDALFDRAKEYYDEPVYHESRAETYKRLAKLAHESVGVDQDQFLKLVTVAPADGEPKNASNALQVDLKYFIRQSRQTGIHVSPTIVVNGIIDNSIESSSPLEVWLEKAKALTA